MGASSANAFYMPAIGYAKKQGNLVYGAGIYCQGGMGTEYANGDMAQVGVGRVTFPLACSVNDRLNVRRQRRPRVGRKDLVLTGYSIDFKDDSDFTVAAKGYSMPATLGPGWPGSRTSG